MNGYPIPFDQAKCHTHPVYLVIPETPESRMMNSISNSPEENEKSSNEKYDMSKFELSLINKLEVPSESIAEPSAKLIKSKSKSKNILRLNTRSGEAPAKNESKRKRKYRATKNVPKSNEHGKAPSLLIMQPTPFLVCNETIKSENVASKEKSDISKDESRGRPLT